MALIYVLLIVGTGASLYWRTPGHVAYLVFWVPLLALLLLQAWEVIVLGRRDANYIVLLVVSVVLVGILLYPKPFQLPGHDNYFDVNFTRTIVDKGKWDPTLGAGLAENYYGYYPCVHLLFGNLAIVAGLPVLSVFKYVAPMAISVSMLAAAYLMLKRSFSIEKGAVASLIYVSSLGFMTVGPSRRATALILGALVIALLFSKPGSFGQGRGRVITAVILLGGLAISDHFIGLVVFASAVSFLVILRILRMPSTMGPSLVVFLGGTMFVGWMLLAASHVLGSDIASYRYFFTKLFSQEILTQNPTSLYGYTTLERTLSLLSWALFGLLAFAGLILLIRSRENRQWVAWGIIGFGMLGISTLVALHPVYGVVSIALSYFGTLLGSALVSVTVVRLTVRLPGNLARIAPLFLLAIMFSGAMLSAYGARTLDRAPDEREACVVEEFSANSPSFEQYELGKWITIHSEPSVSVLGDRGSYVLFSGLFSTSFVQDFSWPERAPQPGEFKYVLVLEGKSYFTCRSTQWKDTNPALAESLGSLNRLLDGGEWRVLSAPQR